MIYRGLFIFKNYINSEENFTYWRNIVHGMDCVDKCVSILALPVWTISFDKSRTIVQRIKVFVMVACWLIRRGRPLGIPRKARLRRAIPFATRENKGEDQNLWLELIYGTEFPDESQIEKTGDPIEKDISSFISLSLIIFWRLMPVFLLFLW